jgi:hypothetical protein
LGDVCCDGGEYNDGEYNDGLSEISDGEYDP